MNEGCSQVAVFSRFKNVINFLELDKCLCEICSFAIDIQYPLSWLHSKYGLWMDIWVENTGKCFNQDTPAIHKD